MGKMICPKDCPNRCISPNCHNPDVCESWRKHLEEKDRIRQTIKKEYELPDYKPGEIKKRAKNLRKR